MANTIDMKLKKAFAELQEEMIDAKRKITVLDAQIENSMQKLHYVNVSRREISTLPHGTNTYQSIGRMFVLTEVDQVLDTFKQRDDQLRQHIVSLQNTKKYLEKNLQQSSDSIREMVQQRKELSEN